MVKSTLGGPPANRLFCCSTGDRQLKALLLRGLASVFPVRKSSRSLRPLGLGLSTLTRDLSSQLHPARLNNQNSSLGGTSSSAVNPPPATGPPRLTSSQTLRRTHRWLQTQPHLSIALLSTQPLPSLQQQTTGTEFRSQLRALDFEVAGTNPFGSLDPSLPPLRRILRHLSQHQIKHTQGCPMNLSHRDPRSRLGSTTLGKSQA